MKDLIKRLDKDLEYITHTIDVDTIHIYVKSVKDNIKCHYCGEYSTKAHSKYKRTFQDLPIQGKKVIITISNRKMFCNNPDCKNKTFTEKFDFINDKSKKTKKIRS